MSEHDTTDEMLRAYFRQRIASSPAFPVRPESARRSLRGDVAIWITRVAAAAAFAAALLTPFADAARLTPGAGTFSAAHQLLDTSGHVTRGLLAAREVLRIRFQGEPR